MANPQVEHWFRLADEDRDGGVGGAEAVRFFTKSGLPQEVLGQIWEYASGGGAKLNMGQFAVAMRLVALAQASGGRLMPDQARVVAMGGGPQLPPPRLAGVTDAPAPHIPTYTPQITGLAPQPSSGGGVGYSPQPTGGYMPQVTGGYPQQQMTGGMRPPSPYGTPPPAAAAAAAAGPTGQYTPQATGYMPAGAGPTGGMAAAGGTGAGVAALPGFPPVTVADLQRYQATFAAVDTDRDGFAKGGECFPVFIKSGLDKALLKRMWDLVAGNAGSLDAQQFLKCMYLMDGCRRGAALPAALPPGPWPQASMVSPAAAGMTGPPGMMQQQQQPPAAAGLTGAMPGPAGLPPAPQLSAGGARDSSSGGMAPLPGTAPLRAESWSLENQFGHKGAVKSISEAYDQTLPKIPDLPGKITFNPAALAAAAAGPSSVPDLDATIADMLVPADKARWEAERSEALEKEKQERQVAADAAAAKARVEAFNAALSELVMYRSRVNVALLQASDSAARLAAEAEDTELRYNKARLAAQSQEEEGKEARQKLQALLARKQEAANKLELLQQEIAMMANLNPAELAALEKEVGALVAAMAAAEAQKAAMEMQLDSGKKQKGLLGERIADLELAAAAGEGDIRRARAELAELQAKLSAAQASVQGGPDLGEVGPLLGKAASAYRRLYSSAAAAGLEVPYEANLNNVGSLVWLEQLMAGTADWVDDDAALSGYTVVNALPDLEGVPPALLRAAAMAAAQQPPVKPAAAAGASDEAAAAEGAAEAAAPAEATAAADGAAEKQPQAEALLAEGQQETAPAAAAVAKDAGKGAVAAVAATTAAAAAAGAAAVALGSRETSSDAAAAAAEPAATAADAAAEPAAAAEAEAAPVEPAATAAVPAAGAAGADADAFGDDAFGDSAFAPEAASAAAETPAEQPAAEPEASEAAVAAADEADADALAAPDAATKDAAAELPASAVSAEPSQLASPADAAAAAGISIEPPAERHFADEDDSDITSPMGHNLMSAVPGAAGSSAAAGGTPVVIGGLAGFDPSLYRLNTDQRQLATQYSMDSSYAGSMAGGAAAGGTGASSSNGFGDDAAFGESSTPGGEDGKAAGSLMGFEDNAF